MNQEKEFSCGACGYICEAEEGTLMIENGEAVFNHEASLCPAQDELMDCQLCGNEIADNSKGAVVLPWGATCTDCFLKIQESKMTKEKILKKINKLDRRMMKVGGLGALVIGKEIQELTEQYHKAIKKENK